MLHPSYTDLMKVVNKDVEEGESKIVNSRYSIVMATSKRARQLIAGELPLVPAKNGDKPLSIAIEELNEGKLKIMAENAEEEEKKKVGGRCEKCICSFYAERRCEIKNRYIMEVTDLYEDTFYLSLGMQTRTTRLIFRSYAGITGIKGYEMTDDEQEADIIVINTCCFIHDAKEESIQNILEMAELKKEGKVKALIVTGCMAERYKDEILEEIPEVDEVLGTTAYDKILDAVDAALREIRK